MAANVAKFAEVLGFELPEAMPAEVRAVPVRLVDGGLLQGPGGGATILGRTTAKVLTFRCRTTGRVLRREVEEQWIELPEGLVALACRDGAPASALDCLRTIVLHEAAHAWCNIDGLTNAGHGPRWAARCRKLGIPAEQHASPTRTLLALGLRSEFEVALAAAEAAEAADTGRE